MKCLCVLCLATTSSVYLRSQSTCVYIFAGIDSSYMCINAHVWMHPYTCQACCACVQNCMPTHVYTCTYLHIRIYIPRIKANMPCIHAGARCEHQCVRISYEHENKHAAQLCERKHLHPFILMHIRFSCPYFESDTNTNTVRSCASASSCTPKWSSSSGAWATASRRCRCWWGTPATFKRQSTSVPRYVCLPHLSESESESESVWALCMIHLSESESESESMWVLYKIDLCGAESESVRCSRANQLLRRSMHAATLCSCAFVSLSLSLSVCLYLRVRMFSHSFLSHILCCLPS